MDHDETLLVARGKRKSFFLPFRRVSYEYLYGMCFLGVIAILVILRFTSRNMGAAAVVRAVAIDLKDIYRSQIYNHITKRRSSVTKCPNAFVSRLWKASHEGISPSIRGGSKLQKDFQNPRRNDFFYFFRIFFWQLFCFPERPPADRFHFFFRFISSSNPTDLSICQDCHHGAMLQVYPVPFMIVREG